MMKLHLVRSALDRVRKAQNLIVSEMAANGIPDPKAIIHGFLDDDGQVECSLYSTAKVFACGIQRLRRRNRVTVIYGREVTEAIAMAERFIRGRLQ